MSPIYSNKPYHKLNASEVLQLLEVKATQGLSSTRVSKARKTYGENSITEEAKESIFRAIIRQLLNPLAIILLIAAALTIVLGEYVDTIVIIIATIINVAISLYQEKRAGDAFKALAQSRSHEAVVIRGGVREVVPIEELVPGDVVLLKAGDYVPADGRVVEASRLSANQVMFTGESEAVNKNSEPSRSEHPFERTSMVFMGSTVVTGEGRMVVTATGDASEFGTIAQDMQRIKKDLSPVQLTMKTIATWLGALTLTATILLLAIGLLQGYELYATVLLAVAVGVSAVPEGLLSAVTVVLAFGARSIMKQGGLVKNLSSAETLGSASFILTDKTGTLTHGKLKVEEWHTSDMEVHDLQRCAVLATDVFYDAKNKRYVGDEMDTAIVHEVYPQIDEFRNFSNSHEELDSIPFDSSYKFFASLCWHENNKTLYLKGAPEILLAQAEYIATADGYRKMKQTEREEIASLIHTESARGRRLVAVAKQENYKQDNLDHVWGNNDQATLPDGLVWCGVVSFYDRIREDVPQVIQDMRQDGGTEVVMVTGDNADTAHRVAVESGVVSDENAQVYTGDDVEQLRDEELRELLLNKQARIFARVTPSHKLRLAGILQEAGEVVAMTGDGVNDALALSRATIGVSLSSSTEVAKEAADLVLIHDAFTTIAHAIQEGRRMMTNLRKTVIYLLSTSFSEVIVLLGSLVVAGPIPFYPTQILWANIVEEGLMNFAFIFEPREKHPHPHENMRQDIIGGHTRALVITVGVVNGITLILLYLFLLQQDMSADLLRTYMFAALSIDSIFFGLSLKSLYNPIWRLRLFSNIYLIGASIISVGLLMLAMIVPFLQTALHVVPIGIEGFALIFAYGLMNLGIFEAAKAWHRPHHSDSYTPSTQTVEQGA
jgi:Ca2+-transporting ATPase